MPSFKVNNWDLDVNKEKSTVSIKAHNPCNNSDFAKELTNEDIAAEGFMLIDDIDDLYASLTEGSKQCEEGTKLSISDDGHLTISQKVKQADREKVFNSDIALDKIEKKEPEKKEPEKKEPETKEKTHHKKEKKSAQEHKFFFDKIAELEGLLKGLQTGYGNDLAELRKSLEEQASRTKALEEENANLKKSLADVEKKLPTINFSFISDSNFNLSNGGKKAISTTSEAHAIYSSTRASKGVTYTWNVFGEHFIMFGLIPENNEHVYDPCSQTGTFGYGSDGRIFPDGGNVSKFKTGDVVSFSFDDSKIYWNLNKCNVSTRDFNPAAANYQLYLYSNCAVGNGGELIS